MPRARAHKLVDCDCIECRDPASIPISLIALEASLAETHDGPLKSIIILLEHALPLSTAPIAAIEDGNNQLPSSNRFPALQQICREGCAGLLAIAEGCHVAPTLPLQLLRRHLDPSLKRKFQDISLHVLTDNNALIDEALELGCSGAEGLGKELLHRPTELAQRVAEILSLSGDGGDMVLLTINTSSLTCYQPPSTASEQVSTSLSTASNGRIKADSKEEGVPHWLEEFIHTALTHRTITANTIISIILGPKGTKTDSEPRPLQQQQYILQPLRFSLSGSREGQGQGQVLDDAWPIIRPRQSFQFSGVNQVAVDEVHPALVMHWLPGVIRRDDVQWFDVQSIQKKGGGGCILAEHVLPELAFKLGRAPKYGA